MSIKSSDVDWLAIRGTVDNVYREIGVVLDILGKFMDFTKSVQAENERRLDKLEEKTGVGA